MHLLTGTRHPQERAQKELERAQRSMFKRKRGPSTPALLLGGILGALVAYFLDPVEGRARQAQARDRLGAFFRRGSLRAGSAGRYAASTAQGWTQRMVTLTSERPEGDDVTIRQRVESELFGDPQIDKGRITIDVESGVVILRGELDDPEQIRTIEQAARGVRGVAGVRSLLHHSGTPAPNKAEAREVQA
jgi:hypothetical protein